MKKSLSFILLVTFFLQISEAQNHKYCGHDMVTEQLKNKVPNYDESFFNMVEKAINEGLGKRQAEQEVYTIQVVVHILFERNNKYQNIPDSIIISQIEALNRDFRLKNSDTSKIRPIFKDVAADVGISFELAKRDPQNRPTNGITRKRWNGTTLLGPLADPFLKTTLLGGQSPWPTQRYLNIWVCDLNKNQLEGGGFLAGYAYPPPGLPEWPPVSLGNPETDGVVIDYRFFGDNNHVARDMIEPVAVFNNMGRTTIHEVGHYLGLRHVWGDLGTLLPDLGCLVDDGIDDTPNAQLPTGGGICYSNTNLNTCIDEVDDKPDMYENYMDYSGDPCYAMFTKQQADLMRWVLVNRRNNIILKNVEATPLETSISACKGDSVELTITNTRDDYQYIWNGEKSNPKIKFLFENDTTFEVEVKNAFNSKTFTIEVKGNPTLINSTIADFDVDVNENNLVSLTPKDSSKTTYLWNFGDGNTSSDIKPTYTYSSDGIYILRLSIPNEASCDTFYFERELEIKTTVTSTIDLQIKYGITVFPNPASSELNIRFSKVLPLNYHYRILDVSGKQVVQKSNPQQSDLLKIPVKNLISGYYFIEITNDKDLISLPFVKE
jgi:hypothetical protein